MIRFAFDLVFVVAIALVAAYGLATVLRDYADRIVPVDAEAAEEWGSINARDPVPVVDGLMAATAKSTNMTLVTRNTSDVARTGARLLNPFGASDA